MMIKKILPALGVAALLAGFYLLYRLLQRLDTAATMQALMNVGWPTIGLGLLLTMGSFLCIGLLEILAVRYAKLDISPGRVMLASTAAIGIGHCIGIALLSSGAIRYRLYSQSGARAAAIGQVIAFSAISVTLGFLTIGGGALFTESQRLAELTALSAGLLQAAGAASLLLALAYIVACAVWSTEFRIRRFSFRLPSLRTALLQVLFAGGNILCIAGVLWVSLAAYLKLGYPTAMFLQVAADMGAIITHVPGGWGVLEHIIVEVLQTDDALMGAILHRAIYYLVPLAVGVLILLLNEIIYPRLAANGAAPATERGAPKARLV